MKTRRVARYNCDFCRRGSFRKPDMEKHERGCTANPNRVCGLCALVGEEQKPTVQLVEYLLDHGLEALQSYVEGCPACTMAAVRSANKDLSDEEKYWFEYKDAYKSWWQEYNENNPIRYR